MAAKKKQKKSGSPPARPKKGVLATATKKLGKVADYLSSQLSSPQGPQLVTQAATLKTSRDAYVTSVGLATTARTAAEQASANALAAEKTLDASIDTYVRAGGTVAAGNATVLSSLAIDVAATATPHAGPATAPSNVVLSMGAESGECKMKWNRPRMLWSLLVETFGSIHTH